ncbi:hypothetical protein BP5796_03197 [Coleophoma crateriformis]|uniref:Heterokaryon incompatibility domain-containing protein n=1 Tax=Coleophoma crateriformis TaxID=565419 RepID=A0A3D8SMF2_9HELO|nr:hypothetical protein BP5796_03197 [Coleophoma crateriformis]
MSKTGRSEFRYEPLNPSYSSFRLAILRKGSKTAPIRVQLVHTTLNQLPVFEALSYTWGLPKPVRPIALNGKRFEIGENLWHALANLRSVTTDRNLWIDALCINQGDSPEALQERSIQVKEMMRTIYSRAETVLVWLGPEHLSSQRKFGVLEASARKEDLRTPSSNSFSLFSFKRFKSRNESLQKSNVGINVLQNHHNHGNTADERELCGRPYWQRVWVIQEIGTAENLHVCWGKNVEPWESFFNRIHTAHPPNSEWALKLDRHRQHRFNDSHNLLFNLVETYRDSQCQDPRDKIYGMMGLARDTFNSNLKVDYEKALFEVYGDVINFHYTSKTDSLYVRRSLIHISQLVQSVLRRSSEDQELNKANGKHLRDWHEDSDISKGRNLEAMGILAGKITDLGPCYHDLLADTRASNSWRTVLARVPGQHRPKLFETFEQFLEALIGLEQGKGFSVHTKTYPVNTNGDIQSDQTTKFFSGLRSSSHGMQCPSSQPRIALTNSYDIGLVPGNSQIGDLVVQFENSEVVAVVRNLLSLPNCLVGRAVLSNQATVRNSNDRSPFRVLPGPSGTKGALGETFKVSMDLLTLSRMTT